MVGVVTPRATPTTKPAEPRVVVAWAGPGEPIVLTVHGPDGEVAVPMVPKRALELAQELLTRAVAAIKADWPGWRRVPPRAGSHTIKFR